MGEGNLKGNQKKRKINKDVLINNKSINTEEVKKNSINKENETAKNESEFSNNSVEKLAEDISRPATFDNVNNNILSKRRRDPMNQETHLTDQELIALNKEVIDHYRSLSEKDQRNYDLLCRHFMIREKKRRILKENPSIVLRLGQFTPKEQKIIGHKVSEYLQMQNKSIRHLRDEILRSSEEKIQKELSQYVCSFLPYREFHSVFFYIFYTYHPYRTRLLGDADDVQLLCLFKAMGPKWQLISQEMETTRFRLSNRFKKIAEDKRLKEAGEEIKKNKIDLLEEYRKTANISNLCITYKLRRSVLIKKINEDISKVVLHEWSEYYDFVLGAMVLKFNHFCGVNGIEEIFEVIEDMVEDFLDDFRLNKHKETTDESEGKNERKIESKGKNESGIENKGRGESRIESEGKEVNDGKYEEKKQEVIDGRLNNEVDKTLKGQASKDHLAENIKKSLRTVNHNFNIKKAEVSSRLISTLSDLTKNKDLKIKMSEHEIFWLSLKRAFLQSEINESLTKKIVNIETGMLKSKFFILASSKRLECFEDLMKWVMERSVYFLFERVKIRLENVV